MGEISKQHLCLGVAGTHGKTTTSTLLAHLLDTANFSFNAFLGGISSNFNNNYIKRDDAEYTVIEADEFDRSFLELSPFASIITSVDPDHLDIYGDQDTFKKGFDDYASLIDEKGFLIEKYGFEPHLQRQQNNLCTRRTRRRFQRSQYPSRKRKICF